MNTFQNEAHKQACRRTVEYFKEHNFKVTRELIEQLLRSMHVFTRNVMHNIDKWDKKEDPTLVHLPFGYIRVIFTRTLHKMYLNGEFTEEEWNVIRNEFYKEQFDVYFKLLKNRKIWKQQRLKTTSKAQVAK